VAVFHHGVPQPLCLHLTHIFRYCSPCHHIRFSCITIVVCSILSNKKLLAPVCTRERGGE
jgi:hypothetical protein